MLMMLYEAAQIKLMRLEKWSGSRHGRDRQPRADNATRVDKNPSDRVQFMLPNITLSAIDSPFNIAPPVAPVGSSLAA
jgi:hypothetical protein